MANSIAKNKNYTSILDEVYKLSSLTAVLDSPPELAKQGANVNEIIIPKLDMQGLANYDRNSGYTTGDVTLTQETVPFNYERGRMFSVDNMDNEESANVAFGRLSGEFIRTKVAPEIDAFRFATLAQTSGITSATPAALTTGKGVIDAISAAVTAFDEAEVPADGRILFITPTLYNLALGVDTTVSKEMLNNLTIIKVPQSRFYTKVTLQNTAAGGFIKEPTAGKDINFLLVHKDAVIQFFKHVSPKIVTPDENQTADAWKFGYRIYGLDKVYENKVAGIYLHNKA